MDVKKQTALSEGSLQSAAHTGRWSPPHGHRRHLIHSADEMTKEEPRAGVLRTVPGTGGGGGRTPTEQGPPGYDDASPCLPADQALWTRTAPHSRLCFPGTRLHPGTLGVQLDTPASPLQKPDPRVATDAGDQSQPSGGKRGGPGPRGPSPASPAPVISAGEVPPSAGRPSGGATGQEQGGLQANDSEWQKRRGDKVE